MKMFNIINRYIFRELLFPFAISLFFLTFVFLMTRIPEITNMVVNYNADLSAVALMIAYTLPRFLEFTIPMSVMISILLTFMRMSGENEIIALKGAGASLYKLLPPVLTFCFIGVALCMWITVFGVSWGKLSQKKKLVEIARTSIDSQLQERQFNSLEAVMIYVSHVDMKTRRLKDVFIEDRRVQGMVRISVAPEGKLIRLEDEQLYTIRLFKGIINMVDADEKTVSTVQFDEYDMNFDLNTIAGGETTIAKELDERSLVELLRYMSHKNLSDAEMSAALMELHEKFAVPFACLALGILAFPLGVQSASLRRSSGFSLGIFFFLLYYSLLAVGWSAGEAGRYPPVVGMWLPNVVMGGIGIFFLYRNAKEKPVPMPRKIQQLMSWVRRTVKRRNNGRLSA